MKVLTIQHTNKIVIFPTYGFIGEILLKVPLKIKSNLPILMDKWMCTILSN